MKAWLDWKKDDFFAMITFMGLGVLLSVAVPYCC